MLEMFLIPSIALLILFFYFLNALNIVPDVDRSRVPALRRAATSTEKQR